MSLEWVCLSPTDVILWKAFGSVIHERSKASPLSCHPERSEAESNPKGAPRSGAGSPPSVRGEAGKCNHSSTDSGTRSRFGFASRPPLGRVRLRKHHTVMFSSLRMTAKGQVSPSRRYDISIARIVGKVRFTNPPVFVRRAPKNRGIPICLDGYVHFRIESENAPILFRGFLRPLSRTKGVLKLFLLVAVFRRRRKHLSEDKKSTPQTQTIQPKQHSAFIQIKTNLYYPNSGVSRNVIFASSQRSDSNTMISFSPSRRRGAGIYSVFCGPALL